ncbi:MAG TPA: beta-eliminating lyase-related protein [Streptosporangiaceae bacterium]|nr:beta-eliminating lyase-related protein [Streptosporangiaceae bacterium]
MANISGKSFGSDNHAGVHQAVLAAIMAANDGDAVAYGDDDITRTAIAQLCDATGAQNAHLVFTGTAANILGLSLLVRPYEAVICAESSHLNVDECGAAERVLGCKLLPVQTPDGKLTPDLIASRLTGRGDEHRVQPRVIQIAQATELGTCYSLDELRELRAFGQEYGLLTYIDGARIANAAAYLDCSLADIAAHADVLSFGGTKNGALGVEAVLTMTDGLADGAQYHRKQQMQLASKMRFLGAQAAALLTDELWLTSASHANAMAARLASALARLPGIRLAYPVQTNGVFTEVHEQLAMRLEKDLNSHVWSEGDDGNCIVRWMTAFDTSAADVDRLAEAIEASIVSRET